MSALPALSADEIEHAVAYYGVTALALTLNGLRRAREGKPFCRPRRHLEPDDDEFVQTTSLTGPGNVTP